MVAHIAQSLNDHMFPLQSGTESERIHIFFNVACFTDPKENPATGCLCAPANPSHSNRFASHARQSIQRVICDGTVGVKNPAHFGAGCAVVRCRHIHPGANKIFLCQFKGVSPRDPLQFRLRVVLPINADSSLCAAIRHIYDGALIRHECCQGHDLVCIDRGSITYPSLGRLHMVTVFGAVGIDDINISIIPYKRETHVIDAVATFNLCKQSWRVTGVFCCAGKHLVDFSKERVLMHGFLLIRVVWKRFQYCQY